MDDLTGIFKMFDVQKKGYITAQDLRDVSSSQSSCDIEQILNLLNLDPGDKLNLYEFCSKIREIQGVNDDRSSGVSSRASSLEEDQEFLGIGESGDNKVWNQRKLGKNPAESDSDRLLKSMSGKLDELIESQDFNRAKNCQKCESNQRLTNDNLSLESRLRHSESEKILAQQQLELALDRVKDLQKLLADREAEVKRERNIVEKQSRNLDSLVRLTELLTREAEALRQSDKNNTATINKLKFENETLQVEILDLNKQLKSDSGKPDQDTLDEKESLKEERIALSMERIAFSIERESFLKSLSRQRFDSTESGSLKMDTTLQMIKEDEELIDNTAVEAFEGDALEFESIVEEVKQSKTIKSGTKNHDIIDDNDKVENLNNSIYTKFRGLFVRSTLSLQQK